MRQRKIPSGEGISMIHIVLAAALLVLAQAPALAQGAPPEAVKELAPTGKLRAAINYGNQVLAQKGPDGPRGVSADLARELARRLAVPLEFVTFEAAGKAFEAAQQNAVDILFIAIDPARAEVEFTPPYVLVEGTYMVREDSPLKTAAEVDRPGVRVAVGLASAYDHYLARTLKNAALVRASKGGCCEMIELFLAEKLEAVAGVRQQLEGFARTHATTRPGLRILEGRFQLIRQAIGTPKGRPATSAYLHAFIEEMKASGFVADSLKRSNQPDAQVAPAGG
jgi:polar amino acid transport system substrate-binding protein